MQFRIPRTLAHVQIIKRREGRRVVQVDIRSTHGSRKRGQQALEYLGYSTPNTSAIERRNGTARRMSAHQVRRSLAFSRRPDTKQALGWWALTVYNWSRTHRALRQPLMAPVGKKSASPRHLRWPWDWLIVFLLFTRSSSPRCFLPAVGDNLMSPPDVACRVYLGRCGLQPGSPSQNLAPLKSITAPNAGYDVRLRWLPN